MKRTHQEQEVKEIPEEVWIQVLGKLWREEKLIVAGVSKRWFLLVTPLVEEIIFPSHARWCLKTIERRAPNLTGLQLTSFAGYNRLKLDKRLVSRLTRLTTLSLFSYGYLPEKFDCFKALTKLESLCLRHVKVKKDVLPKLTNLKTLAFLEAGVKDRDLTCLTNLTVLNTSREDQDGISDKGLSQLTKLETLLTGNDFSKEVVSKLTNLKKLVLYDNTQINWKTVKSLPKLEEFTFCACTKLHEKILSPEWKMEDDCGLLVGKRSFISV